MGSSTSKSTTNATVAATATLRQSHPQSSEESKLRQAIQELLDKLRGNVNVVFSGPICIGVSQFCDTFASNYTSGRFVYIDPLNLDSSRRLSLPLPPQKQTPLGIRLGAYKQQIERLEIQRSEVLHPPTSSAAERARSEALVFHAIDLHREVYLHELLLDTSPDCVATTKDVDISSTADREVINALHAPFRVFYGNAHDYVYGFARASLGLEKLNTGEFAALEMQGQQAWNASWRAPGRAPCNTVFVYLTYDDDVYQRAYQAYSSALRQHDTEGGLVLDRMQHQSRLAKQQLDIIYQHRCQPQPQSQNDTDSSSDDLVRKYYSMAVSFSAAQLLSPLHGLALTFRLLTILLKLQTDSPRSGWGNESAVSTETRLRYLNWPEWQLMRMIQVPQIISNRIATDPNEFRYSSPSLPRSIAVHPQVSRVRTDEGVHSAPPAPVLTKSSTSLSSSSSSSSSGSGGSKSPPGSGRRGSSVTQKQQ
jgi:hypothetical protein